MPAWFLHVFADKFATPPMVMTRNNLLASAGAFSANVAGQHQGNFFTPSTVLGDPAIMDFTLAANSWLRGRVDALAPDPEDLQPKFEHLMPGRVSAITPPSHWAPGALQAATVDK